MGIRQITTSDAIKIAGGTPCASCCSARATTSLDGDPLCGPCKTAVTSGADEEN